MVPRDVFTSLDADDTIQFDKDFLSQSATRGHVLYGVLFALWLEAADFFKCIVWKIANAEQWLFSSKFPKH